MCFIFLLSLFPLPGSEPLQPQLEHVGNNCVFFWSSAPFQMQGKWREESGRREIKGTGGPSSCFIRAAPSLTQLSRDLQPAAGLVEKQQKITQQRIKTKCLYYCKYQKQITLASPSKTLPPPKLEHISQLPFPCLIPPSPTLLISIPFHPNCLSRFRQHERGGGAEVSRTDV